MLDNDELFRKIYTPYKNLSEVCHTARYTCNDPASHNCNDCEDHLNTIKTVF